MTNSQPVMNQMSHQVDRPNVDDQAFISQQNNFAESVPKPVNRLAGYGTFLHKIFSR